MFRRWIKRWAARWPARDSTSCGSEPGRHPKPSAAVIDRQSVKNDRIGRTIRFDGGKRVHGRKRHIVTDTLGLLLAVVVHRADINDSQRVPHLLDRVQAHASRLEVVYANEGYAATPAGMIWRLYGWSFRRVRRLDPGFVVLAKRWVVERTFAWFGGYRRLSKDYERQCVTSAAMVQLAAIRLMARRLG